MADGFTTGCSATLNSLLHGTRKSVKVQFGGEIKSGDFLSNYRKIEATIGEWEGSRVLFCSSLSMFLVCTVTDTGSRGNGYIAVRAFDSYSFGLLFSSSIEGRSVDFCEKLSYLCSAGGRNKGSSPTRYWIYKVTRSGLTLQNSGSDGRGGDGQYTQLCCSDDYCVFSAIASNNINILNLNNFTLSSVDVGYYMWCPVTWVDGNRFLALSSSDWSNSNLTLFDASTAQVISKTSWTEGWACINSFLVRDGNIIAIDREGNINVIKVTGNTVSYVKKIDTYQSGYYMGFMATGDNSNGITGVTYFYDNTFYRVDLEGNITSSVVSSVEPPEINGVGLIEFPLFTPVDNNNDLRVFLYSNPNIEPLICFKGNSAMVAVSSAKSLEFAYAIVGDGVL